LAAAGRSKRRLNRLKEDAMPTRKEDLPSTLKRSPAKVQRTYAKALDNAEEQYGDAERARRTAWSSVKHVAEKKGDHWEVKDEKGPSDPRASDPGARAGRGESYGGVDASKPKKELLEDARRAGIPGRSKMSKRELAQALKRHNDRETARARRS
jgi:hypothetical protein